MAGLDPANSPRVAFPKRALLQSPNFGPKFGPKLAGTSWDEVIRAARNLPVTCSN